MDALLKSILALAQLPSISSAGEEGAASGALGELGPLLQMVMALLQSSSTGGQADISSLLQSFAHQQQGASETPATVPSTRGVMAVTADDMTPELRQFFGANKDEGVLVVSTEENSVAMNAGVQVGDVIIAIDGNRVTASINFHAIAEAVLQSGNPLTLTIIRNHAELDILIAL